MRNPVFMSFAIRNGRRQELGAMCGPQCGAPGCLSTTAVCGCQAPLRASPTTSNVCKPVDVGGIVIGSYCTEQLVRGCGWLGFHVRFGLQIGRLTLSKASTQFQNSVISIIRQSAVRSSGFEAFSVVPANAGCTLNESAARSTKRRPCSTAAVLAS